MEVWAFEAYGAAHLLQEIMTVKSDDMVGRAKTYEAIIKGKTLPNPSVPESFRVMTKELAGLGLDVTLYDVDGYIIDPNSTAKALEKEENEMVDDLKEEFNKFEFEEFTNSSDYDDEE